MKRETRALVLRSVILSAFDPRTVVTETGFIKSRHLDDKVSAAILLTCLVSIRKKIELLP